MLWPAPASRRARAIETPEARPGMRIWNPSSSFFAAAIFAVVVAAAGTWAFGRIFCAAGATQTWAADAEPAASKATGRGSVFTDEPPWLAASRNGGCSPFRLANSGGLPLIARMLYGAVRRAGCLSGGRGLARTYTYPSAPGA